MNAGDTDRQPAMTDDLLHGYADGRLDPAAAAEVEAWLETHPEAANEIAGWRRQNGELHALLDAVAAEPIPARLDVRAMAHGAADRRRRIFGMAAAAMLVLMVGAGAGWAGRTFLLGQPPVSARLMAGALAAHDFYAHQSRHVVEMDGSDRAQLTAWLSRGIGRNIVTPNLAAQGFALVGGRLLPPPAGNAVGPAAQLIYQNATAQRVTLYITAAPTTPGPAAASESQRGVEAYYWADRKITCTVVGDLPEPEMDAVARSAAEQLSWRPGAPA
jgi:anti-sigma factor RsiW